MGLGTEGRGCPNLQLNQSVLRPPIKCFSYGYRYRRLSRYRFRCRFRHSKNHNQNETGTLPIPKHTNENAGVLKKGPLIALKRKIEKSASTRVSASRSLARDKKLYFADPNPFRSSLNSSRDLAVPGLEINNAFAVAAVGFLSPSSSFGLTSKAVPLLTTVLP